MLEFPTNNLNILTVIPRDGCYTCTRTAFYTVPGFTQFESDVNNFDIIQLMQIKIHFCCCYNMSDKLIKIVFVRLSKRMIPCSCVARQLFHRAKQKYNRARNNFNKCTFQNRCKDYKKTLNFIIENTSMKK